MSISTVQHPPTSWDFASIYPEFQLAWRLHLQPIITSPCYLRTQICTIVDHQIDPTELYDFPTLWLANENKKIFHNDPSLTLLPNDHRTSSQQSLVNPIWKTLDTARAFIPAKNHFRVSFHLVVDGESMGSVLKRIFFDILCILIFTDGVWYRRMSLWLNSLQSHRRHRMLLWHEFWLVTWGAELIMTC
jgi:hypothetical protein